MRQQAAILLIADISGYTRFLKFHATSLLHAEEIVTDLIEAVIDGVEFPLTIAKLEGDAVFLYAEVPDGQQAAAASSVHDQMRRMFVAFNARERALIGCRHGCVCEACQNIGELKLKVIVHTGVVAIKQIRQFTEVAGQDVILLHRLLKNSVPAREYVLMTQPMHALAGDYDGQTPERRIEHIDDFGPVPVWVYYPAVHVDSTDVPPLRGPQLSLSLNRHSFARLLRSKQRSQFNHLPEPRLNLIMYLLEGISSGINTLRQSFSGQRGTPAG